MAVHTMDSLATAPRLPSAPASKTHCGTTLAPTDRWWSSSVASTGLNLNIMTANAKATVSEP